MSVFWWEEGYDMQQALQAEVENLRRAHRLHHEGKGDRYLANSVVTDLHHLHGMFFNRDSSLFITLNEAGKGNFQRHASVSIYRCGSVSDAGQSQSQTSTEDESGTTEACGQRMSLSLERSFEVGDNSGYMALSADDSTLAVAALKTDKVMIYEVKTGDLLINLSGGRKIGYWGSLWFLPQPPDAQSRCRPGYSPNPNNILLELRVTELLKGKAKSSVLRCWDLGFAAVKNENYAAGVAENKAKKEGAGDSDADSDSDRDDDEMEEKLWEVEKAGGISHGSLGYMQGAGSAAGDSIGVTNADDVLLLCTFENTTIVEEVVPTKRKVVSMAARKRAEKNRVGRISAPGSAPPPEAAPAATVAAPAPAVPVGTAAADSTTEWIRVRNLADSSSSASGAGSSSGSAAAASATDSTSESGVSGGGGTVLHTEAPHRWSSRAVASRTGRFVAVGHFAYCTVHDTHTGEVVSTIRSPDPNEVYPVTPVTFLSSNVAEDGGDVYNADAGVDSVDCWLLLRINYDRTILLCDWRLSGSSKPPPSPADVAAAAAADAKKSDSKATKGTGSSSSSGAAVVTTTNNVSHGGRNMVIISNVGGTISDNCIAVSRDENKLLCWPFGYIEVYDLASMKRLLRVKQGKVGKVQLVLLRALMAAKRASLKPPTDLGTDMAALSIDASAANTNTDTTKATTPQAKWQAVAAKLVDVSSDDLFRNVLEYA